MCTKMRNFLMKSTGLFTVLLGLMFVAQAHALQVVKTDNTQLSIGGLIQAMGEAEYVSNDTIGNPLRIYLWNTADRLYTSGSYKGFDWRFETFYGGTANFTGTHTNGLLNLGDAYLDLPLIQNALYLKVGQFKDPTNIESATDSSAMLFTEKSPDFNLFFNAGYEMGAAFVGNLGNFNAVFGVVQGAPNLPQRYLPEQLHMPLPMLLRVGYSNGITADPFHQVQTGFDKPSKLAYAVHLNGFVAANSNAGHSNLFSQMGSGLATFNYNQDYNGNVLLSSVFNPYMGIAGPAQPVNGLYYQTSADFQVRTPLSNGSILALQGVGATAHFQTTVESGDTGKVMGATPAVGTSYKLNIYGGELIASLQGPKLSYATRVAMVIPDSGLKGTSTNATTYGPIFANTNPIWEVTPSVTYSFNKFVKLTTEVMMMFNAPEAQDMDGNYVIAEEPATATGTSYNTANIAAAFVPIGRMSLQIAF